MSTQLIHRRHLKQYIGDAKSILDVGCGNKPLRVATCIADKFPDTYTHKGKVHTENPKGMIKMLPGVKFVEATLPQLPFKDKEFDFVFCSHVIEHVDDVAAGLKELARVARRGYLECPRWWFELHAVSQMVHRLRRLRARLQEENGRRNAAPVGSAHLRQSPRHLRSTLPYLRCHLYRRHRQTQASCL